MTRRELREHIFTLIFMADFHTSQEMPRMVGEYFSLLDPPADEKSYNYIREKFLKILDLFPTIDSTINEKAEGWTVDRMGRVELSLIRLGAYEILYDEEIPTSVAINEAVELAKKYGPEDARAFVNGVLAKFVVVE
ncbi:MAG: transcription antitermination factor NusB [Lachnospiraceae bacterium]|nr:transcription antitermination factor NusB [Lachnospiraceae bacterium]